MTKEELMRKAIELSVKNVAEGGGPFGAVIAKNGEIVATVRLPSLDTSHPGISSEIISTSATSTTASCPSI